MRFEDFLRIVSAKVGAKSAFDLSRDARFQAIESILVEKGIVGPEEIKAEKENQLEKIARKIERMPPPPKKG